MHTAPQPLVTAIVSTYASAAFMEGCLQNLASQSIFHKMEVIVVDAASPEDEGSIVRAFQKKYSNIRYIRTKERIGIYAAWNIGVREAHGKYLTNANTDDRRHPHCTEKLVQSLENNPRAALAYCDIAITNQPNAPFEQAPVTGHFRWLGHDHLNLLRRCEIGPMPVWRASLHDSIGLFDDRYFGAGDYEFWLRASEAHAFIHLPEVLGVYLQYDNNLETRNMQRKLNEEYLIKSTYIQRFLDSGLSQQQGRSLLAVHKNAVTTLVDTGNAQETPDKINRLEHHYYASALLLTAMGHIQEAATMLEDWLSTRPSRNMAHLLHAVILRDKPKHTSDACVTFIATTTYPSEFFARTLDSVLAQQHPHWELLILDTQNTLGSLPAHTRPADLLDSAARMYASGTLAEDIAKLSHQHLRVLCMDDLPDIHSADDLLREALVQARGKYICILPAGNLIAPHYVADATYALEHNVEAGWVSPKTLLFGTEVYTAWGKPFCMDQALKAPPAVRSALFRKQAWEKAGSPPVRMKDFENWTLWITLAEHGWKAMHLDTMGVIKTVGHNENLHAAQRSTARLLVAEHPWWFEHSNGNTVVNTAATAAFDASATTSQQAGLVCAMRGNTLPKAPQNGKLRLAEYYLNKKKPEKAQPLLKQILAEMPDHAGAHDLMQKMEHG